MGRRQLPATEPSVSPHWPSAREAAVSMASCQALVPKQFAFLSQISPVDVSRTVPFPRSTNLLPPAPFPSESPSKNSTVATKAVITTNTNSFLIFPYLLCWGWCDGKRSDAINGLQGDRKTPSEAPYWHLLEPFWHNSPRRISCFPPHPHGWFGFSV